MARRVLGIVAAAAALALAAPAPAGAVVTHSNVTTPADPLFIQVDDDNPGTLHVEGTSDGSSVGTDMVHIGCVDDTGVSLNLGGNLPVDLAGDFEGDVPLGSFSRPRACMLEALDQAQTMGDPPGSSGADFTGPRAFVGLRRIAHIGGPSTPVAGLGHSTVKPFTVWEHWQTGSCVINDTWIINPTTLEPSEDVFFCNAWLNLDNTGETRPATRSEVVVDNVNAYLPITASHINGSAAHYPAPAIGRTYDPANGDLTMFSTERIVRCNNNTTLPPTAAKCSDFVNTGVSVQTSVSDTGVGTTSRVVQRFFSTDGRTHSLDLLWDEETQHGAHNGGIRFPWVDSTYKPRAEGDTVPPPPAGPGSVLVKSDLAGADGTLAGAQGAMTWAAAPSRIVFLQGTNASFGYSTFNLAYRRTVTPSRPAFFGWTFTLGLAPAPLLSAASAAQATYTPHVAITGPPAGAKVARSKATVTGSSSDASGDPVTVRVNGVAASVKPGGSWSAKVPVNVGPTTLTAVATNRYGATARALRPITGLFVGAAFGGAKSLKLGKGGKVLVRILCPAGSRGRCRGTAALVTLKRLLLPKRAFGSAAKRRRVKLGSKSFSVKPGKTGKVRIKIRRRGRKLIGQRGKLAAKLTIKSHDGSGRNRTKTAKVTLKP